MTNRTLSPAAQAVLNAANYAFDRAGTTRQGLAAALRAAAVEVCLRWAELQHPSDVLNAIADELEGAND